MIITPMSREEFQRLPTNQRRSSYRHNLKKLLQEFLNTGVYAVKITDLYPEYTSFQSAHAALCLGARRYRYPIQVTAIEGDLYLINLSYKEDSRSQNMKKQKEANHES